MDLIRLGTKEIVFISKNVTTKEKKVAIRMYLNPLPYLMIKNVFELIILFFKGISFCFKQFNN